MNRKGFTLIELLIVVAIISILAGIVLVGLRPSLQTARDARRVAEIKQIQTGLQLYYNRQGVYPADLNELLSSGVVTALPLTDPAGKPYGYSEDGAGGYILGTTFEEQPTKATQNQVTTGQADTPDGPIDCDPNVNPKAYCVSF